MGLPASYLQEHRSERLRMRPLTEAHIAPWASHLRDARSTHFYLPEYRDFPEAKAEEWIVSQQLRYAEGRFGLLALHLEDGTFVGQCGLITQEIDGETVIEIGYHLLFGHTGKGYATEAARYFKDYAQAQRIAPFVTSFIRTDNFPSQAVARRNDMEPWKESTWRGQPVIVFKADLTDTGVR